MGCLLLSSECLFALGGLHEAIQEACIKVPTVCRALFLDQVLACCILCSIELIR